MGADARISQLVLEVSAQTALAQRSLNDLARVVSTSTGQMNSSLATLSATTQTRMAKLAGSFNAARTAMTGLFAVAGVGFLTSEIKKSIDYAGSIAEVSRTLGVTTKDLQTFRFAATQTGVAQDQLEVGLRRLTVSMGKAELGSQAQIKAFNSLGITVDQIKGKTTGDIFRLMSDALSKVTDRSQRAAVEMTLMGRSGSTLDNLLAPGVGRLNELADAAQQLGIVLSDKQIQDAEETAHKLEALKMVLSAQIAGVVTENASSIITLANALGFLISKTGQAVQGWRIMINEFNAFGNAAAHDIGLAFHGGTGGLQNPLTAANDATRVQAFHDRLSASLAAKAARPSGGADLSQFLGGGGGGGRHRGGGGSVDHSAEHDDEFARESAQLDAELLSARKDLVAGYDTLAELAAQEVEEQKQVKLDEVQKKLDAKQITAAQADQLRLQIDDVAAAKEASVARKKYVDGINQLAESAQQEAQFKIADLKFADETAKTQSEKRALELQILDIQYQVKKAELDRLLLLVKSNRDFATSLDLQQQAADLQAQINHLPTEKAQDQQRVQQGTLNPLEQYFSNIPHTAAEVTQALQGIEVQGIQGLVGALTQAGKGWGAMRDAAVQALQDIAAQLIQLGIEKMLFSLFGNAVLGGAGGAIGGGFAAASAAPMAVDIGSSSLFSGVSFGSLGYADGGFVSGRGGPTSDTIPAMLSNGEYVMSAAAVRMFGPGFLDAINEGRLPHKKGGGLLGLLSLFSPLAFLATGGGKKINPLALLSPALFFEYQRDKFLFDLLFGKHHHHKDDTASLPQMARIPLPQAANSNAPAGDTNHFHIHVAAPNTGDPIKDRATSLQQATDIRHAVAQAVSKGLV